MNTDTNLTRGQVADLTDEQLFDLIPGLAEDEIKRKGHAAQQKHKRK